MRRDEIRTKIIALKPCASSKYIGFNYMNIFPLTADWRRSPRPAPAPASACSPRTSGRPSGRTSGGGSRGAPAPPATSRPAPRSPWGQGSRCLQPCHGYTTLLLAAVDAANSLSTKTDPRFRGRKIRLFYKPNLGASGETP